MRLITKHLVHMKRHCGRGLGTSGLGNGELKSQAFMQSVVITECLLCARLRVSWELGLQC